MDLIGSGLYTPSQVARLTGARTREVGRWLFGYHGGSGKFHPPLWTSQIQDSSERAVGFRDLMEFRVVTAFMRHGVPLRTIRLAIRAAQETFATPYPFTANRFLTDGRSVFYEALNRDIHLTDLLKKQIVFDEIIRPSLYSGIEFDADGFAQRWFPVARSRTVVLDPELSFGRPSLTSSGVPTEIVAAAFDAERSKQRVAAQFDIPIADVAAALRFERQLLAA